MPPKLNIEPGMRFGMWTVLKYEKPSKWGNGKSKWWGYLHQNGTIQLKRWWGDRKDYTDDCRDNPFVSKVVPPFEAETREEALEILRRELGGGSGR